jgi:hypothetical protein
MTQKEKRVQQEEQKKMRTLNAREIPYFEIARSEINLT